MDITKNIYVCNKGHVDAGKSTLMGHLLYLLGEVNEKTMKKYERDSSKIGKSSFAYAWILDETGEERSRYDKLSRYVIIINSIYIFKLFRKL